MIAQLITSLLVAGSVLFTASASDSGSNTSTDRYHPGGTDGRGCHVCRTNCGRWGIPYDHYHRHNPVRPCNQVTPAPTRTPTPTPPPVRLPTRTPTQVPAGVTPPRTSVQQPDGKVPFLDLANSKSVNSRPQTEIANTGGVGIALRGQCFDGARTNLVWPEGLGVVVFAQGTGSCSGWSVVGANGSHTWVRDRYLKGYSPTPSPKTNEPSASGTDSSIDLSNSRSLISRPPREIANTGGIGIALRATCADSARTSRAWPEGQKVVIRAEGTGPCLGWSVAAAGESQTWVRNRYLRDVQSSSTSNATSPGGEGYWHSHCSRIRNDGGCDRRFRPISSGMHHHPSSYPAHSEGKH